MAYSDDINALNPSHAWSFDGNANDRIGSANGTNTGGLFTGSGLCEDVSGYWTCNSINDHIDIPDTTTINGVQDRVAFAGWFEVTGTQNPPKRVFGVGGSSAMQIILGWGNALMFEVASAGSPSFGPLQIFGDVDLENNRPYHLCCVFEGSAYGNEFRAYLDGVEQLNAEPGNRQPNATQLPARTDFGKLGVDGIASTYVGGTAVVLLSPIEGQYNEWAVWNGANAQLSDTEIREELFEKGAKDDVTITNQSGLDALADTVRPNKPLCIRVDVAGSIDLTADNVTFDPLASIHVQYTGTGTLNWTNTNGSNASIGSTPNGGTINFINPATLTVANLIDGAEVRIYDNEVANIGNNDTELAGIESNTGTTFQYAHSGAVNTVVLQMMATGYEEIRQEIVLGASDQTVTVFPVVETNA